MDYAEINVLISKAKMHDGCMGLVFDYKYNGIDCICKLYNLKTFYLNSDSIKNSINIFLDISSKKLNICPEIFFVLNVNDIIILVMEKIKGISFFELHDKNLSIEDTSDIIKSLYTNINILHSLGYSHCDLNPNNIMLDQNNNVVFIDFDDAEKKDKIDSSFKEKNNITYMERDTWHLKYHIEKLLFKCSYKDICKKKFELNDVFFYKQNKKDAICLYNLYCDTIKNYSYCY